MRNKSLFKHLWVAIRIYIGIEIKSKILAKIITDFWHRIKTLNNQNKELRAFETSFSPKTKSYAYQIDVKIIDKLLN